MKYRFVCRHSPAYPVTMLCRVMQVSRSAYYAWLKRPAKLITAKELHLYRCAKALFTASRNSLGSRELSKNLRKEGFIIGRYRTQTLIYHPDKVEHWTKEKMLQAKKKLLFRLRLKKRKDAGKKIKFKHISLDVSDIIPKDHLKQKKYKQLRAISRVSLLLIKKRNIS